MKIFVVLLSALAAAAAVDIDWTNIQPRHVNPEILKELPFDTPLNRITGGNEAAPQQFPHQVAMIMDMEKGGRGFCGGSIISCEWILTAAHCVDGARQIHVKLGAHNVKDPNDPNVVEQTISKDNIHRHEEYNPLIISNDIALLRMSCVKFNKNIQPINLPRASDAKNNFEGYSVVASGWGKPTDNASGISDVLRFITTKIQKLFICKMKTLFIASDNNICIDGKHGKSTCNGDSGGPLIAIDSEGSNVLIGCTSFGMSFGCEKGFPAVFTRVTSYLDWIINKTKIELRP